MPISGSQENVRTTRDIGAVPADAYRGYANVITVGGIVEPKLTDLSGDAYNRQDLAVLNDAEFTELLSSIEGIGVPEFFSLYEELKDIIPGGTLDISFEVDATASGSTFNLIDDAVNAIKVNDLARFSSDMVVLRGKIGSLTDALSNPTPQSHAYLITTSAPYVVELNKRFKAVFDRITELMIENANLRAENDALLAEIAELKKQITQLNDLIIKLTAPPSSGFQIVPDVFTIDTQGPTWKAGDAVEIVVCGSADYTFVAGKGYEGKFKWYQTQASSRWTIITDRSLVGQTAYISAIANDAPSQIASKPSEQIVFVFPPAPEPEQPSALQSSAGTSIQLFLPDETTNWEDFLGAGYTNIIVSTIIGGTPPYTLRVNVPEIQQFFNARFGNELA